MGLNNANCYNGIAGSTHFLHAVWAQPQDAGVQLPRVQLLLIDWYTKALHCSHDLSGLQPASLSLNTKASPVPSPQKHKCHLSVIWQSDCWGWFCTYSCNSGTRHCHLCLMSSGLKTDIGRCFICSVSFFLTVTTEWLFSTHLQYWKLRLLQHNLL